MKTTPWLLLVVLPLILFSSEVKPGDGIDQVRNTLGTPRGQLHLGNRELWSFARGEVELTSGVVTRVALRSEAAQAAFETKRTAEVSQVREEQEIRRGQLTAEGEALKASKLADVSFQSASPRLQAEFWQNFAIKYPRVSCTEQLSLARACFYEQEHAEQLAAEEAQRRVGIKARESEQNMFYPIYSYDPYYEARRQDRLDREYYERLHGARVGLTDASCRHDRLNSGFPDPNSGKASSQPVMAFSGQNWLGWLTPTETEQLKAREQTDSRNRIY